ncbi:AAA family ATPase [Cohnella sp. REN36]|uniref:AAA family ATPase n=1 Tax=Cohnella sp. REN36 TaxID=2887347 RepID=UPI0027154E27|nr:AAA family ATPase [Cohnella sp. REN36]
MSHSKGMGWSVRPLSAPDGRGTPGTPGTQKGMEVHAYLDACEDRMGSFLPAARQLAEWLNGWYREGRRAPAIRTNRFVIRPEEGEGLKLALPDFASNEAYARSEADPVYSPPEESGSAASRDERGDLYALGVVFYEWLTGRLPLSAADAAEWAYVRKAVRPEPVRTYDRLIPESVSAIVAKLLAKSPEERYQSAAGLQADLARCEADWARERRIAPFPLGTRDRSSALRRSGPLRGREAEEARFEEIWTRCAGGSAAALMIAGAEGVGKSVLASALVRRVEGEATVVTGKFDPLLRGRPYEPLAEALRVWVRRLLTEPEERLGAWKRKLQRGLGSGCALLAELVPELKLLVEPPAKTEAMPEAAAERRFQAAFLNMMHLCCEAARPLVVLLDDLHWADKASWKLLQALMADRRIKGLLLIGTYRPAEEEEREAATGEDRSRASGRADGLEGPTRPDPEEELREMSRHAGVHRLSLFPLPLRELNRVVSDALGSAEEEVYGLSALLFRKTAGNPYYSRRLLQKIHEGGLLRYRPATEDWIWDAQAIEETEDDESLVRFMVREIRRLPDGTRQLLTIAAALGGAFEAAFLAEVAGLPLADVFRGLAPAAAAGLLLPDGEAERAPAFGGEGDPGTPAAGHGGFSAPAAYRFGHDRVRQTAYAELTPDRRRDVHAKAGRLILARSEGDEREQRLFEIVGHLNLGMGGKVGTPAGESDTSLLARLSLRAGRKAKAAFDYGAARHYLSSAESLLGPEAWERDFDARFELALDRLSCEYALGDLASADAMAGQLMAKARRKRDRVRVYKVQMDHHINANRHRETITWGFKLLDDYGVRLPRRAGKWTALRELALTRAMLRLRISRIERLPEMREADLRSVSEVLVAMANAAGFSDDKLLAVLVSRAVRLSLRHGNGPVSPEAYAAFAGIVGLAFRDERQADRLARAALRLADAPGVGVFRKNNVYGALYPLMIRLRPLRHMEPYLRQLEQFTEESGSTYSSGILASMRAGVNYLSGRLYRLAGDLPRGEALAEELRDTFLRSLFRLYGGFLRHLQDRAEERLLLAGDEAREAEWVADIRADETRTLLLSQYYTLRIQLVCLLGRPSEAVRLAEDGREALRAVPFVPYYREYLLYAGVAAAQALAEGAGPLARTARKLLADALRQMRAAAAAVPDNYAHKLVLLEAETARLHGKGRRAEVAYERAANLAREQEAYLDAALAGERAASWYRDRGRATTASAFAWSAYLDYLRAGATVKAERMREAYDGFGRSQAPVAATLREEAAPAAELVRGPDREGEGFAGPVRENKVDAEDGDLAAGAEGAERHAAAAASDAWRDIRLLRGMSGVLAAGRPVDEQVRELLRLLAMHAGAQKACLVVGGDPKSASVAAVWSAGRYERPDPPVPVEDSPDLCAGAVQYALRTASALGIEDAAGDPTFAGDPYVRLHRVRSLYALPIPSAAGRPGLLYLENALIAGAFAEPQPELWHVVAAQTFSLLSIEAGDAALAETGAELDPLTGREREVLAVLAAGLSNKEMAAQLGLTEGTVKVHINRIYSKLGVKRRTQAVEAARRRGLV